MGESGKRAVVEKETETGKEEASAEEAWEALMRKPLLQWRKRDAF